MSTTAKQTHPWEFEHDDIGWNDRLPNINAAIGVAQLEKLEERLHSKRLLVKRYQKEFSDAHNIEIIKEAKGGRSNNWLVTLRFTQKDPIKAENERLKLLKGAHSKGLLLRPVWKPLNRAQMYAKCPSGDLNIAENEAHRLLNLPSSPQLLRAL